MSSVVQGFSCKNIYISCTLNQFNKTSFDSLSRMILIRTQVDNSTKEVAALENIEPNLI
ncbi:hypothetical protein BgiBS90_013044, partial [Biomphalaria glabrata]